MDETTIEVMFAKIMEKLDHIYTKSEVDTKILEHTRFCPAQKMKNTLIWMGSVTIGIGIGIGFFFQKIPTILKLFQ